MTGNARSRSHDTVVYEQIVIPPTDSFYWSRDDYPLSWTIWNAHPECEIHLITNASGTCHIGDYIGDFRPGELFLIGRGQPHHWVSPMAKGGEKIRGRDVVLLFDEDRLSEAGGLLPELSALEHFLVLARRGIVFDGPTREAGAALLERIGPAKGMARLALFLELLTLLAHSTDRRLLASEIYTANLEATPRRALHDTLTWLSQNYQTEVRLQTVAEMNGMTESSFSRYFKRSTGVTFSQYLSDLRIAKACELLVRTEMPVTEISLEVGYLNLSNFNRAFRQQRQMTPSQYRRDNNVGVD